MCPILQMFSPEMLQALHAVRLANLIPMRLEDITRHLPQDNNHINQHIMIFMPSSSVRSLQRVEAPRPSRSRHNFIRLSPNLPNGLDVPPPVRRRW